MNLFPLFQTVLYTISTALLYPVVLLLIFLSVWMMVYAGGFAAEWVKRRRFSGDQKVSDAMEQIHELGAVPVEMQKSLPMHIVVYSQGLAHLANHQGRFTAERIEDLNQEKTAGLQKEVDKIRMIIRIGPSLGLMGTLIPMGTGLAGLTQGNMAQLSSSLILAFTTTVVGLALGICAHFFSVVKEQWMFEDMRRINLITEALAESANQKINQVKAA
ncbi:MotA/TolQ/ExbB proton channel family protein [Desulfospira joergensenii]|uniref:MotA/TolQ/ExbB proton channel family protein n=1 Tax=Desulfospira joergensenii TaxID=53329 RepID=UPI0003B56BBC|nr:MotA/TolQ/ExbB proton channel family protein [Desulfospira joergensenii]